MKLRAFPETFQQALKTGLWSEAFDSNFLSSLQLSWLPRCSQPETLYRTWPRRLVPAPRPCTSSKYGPVGDTILTAQHWTGNFFFGGGGGLFSFPARDTEVALTAIKPSSQNKQIRHILAGTSSQPSNNSQSCQSCTVYDAVG